MPYTFVDHLHNFAVWTAARASQRNYTTTKNIKEAIDQTQLKKLIISNRVWNSNNFDKFHRKCCHSIIRYLTNKNIKTTYGRAAKIVAIYIKTAIVIPNSGNRTLAKIAHPPIDNILLSNLHKENKNLKLAKEKWTLWKEDEYFVILKKLRTLQLSRFWEIEKYWSPIQKK
jgi:ribosomal protein L33